jgi:hypothetical protein
LLQAVLTGAVEAGYTTAVLPAGAEEQAAAWMRVVKFNPLFQEPGGVLQDAAGAQVSRNMAGDHLPLAAGLLVVLLLSKRGCP